MDIFWNHTIQTIAFQALDLIKENMYIQQQQQQVYLQVKYSLHIKLVPAISEGYSRQAQEKKGKFHNRYMYIKRAILEAI